MSNKSEIRTYSNVKGSGKVFSFDLVDEKGGEIRITCFNETVDMFYNMVASKGIYSVSKGSLKNKRKVRGSRGVR